MFNWLFNRSTKEEPKQTLHDYKNTNITRLKPFKNRHICEYLDIGHNKVAHIPALFEQKNVLNAFYLNNNIITEIDSDAFFHLSNLTVLDLSSNFLTWIEKNLFGRLVNLRQLFLNDNIIEAINSAAFHGLDNLIELNLSANRISHVNDTLFAKLSKLKTLNLSWNQIVSIDKCAFKNLSQITELDVSDNSLETLKLDFQTFNSDIFINFSANQLDDVTLSFAEKNYSKPVINLASNNFRDFCKIKIQSTNGISKYRINVRSNSIGTLGDDMYSHFYDLRNNPLTKASREIVAANPHNFEQLEEEDAPKMISEISFLGNKTMIQKWEDIANFSVVTSIDDDRTSILLIYFVEVFYEFYKELETYSVKSPDANITKFGELGVALDERKKLKIDRFYVPVVFYSTGDRIEVKTIDGIPEKVIEDFFFKFDKSTLKESKKRALDFYRPLLDFFRANSIDKMILAFRNKEQIINNHYMSSEYKIKICDDCVKFLGKERELDASQLSITEQITVIVDLWKFVMAKWRIPFTPILLLNKIDTTLPPATVSDLVQTLEKLSQSGVQVVMATCNLITVATVKEENLFLMKTSDIQKTTTKFVVEKVSNLTD